MRGALSPPEVSQLSSTRAATKEEYRSSIVGEKRTTQVPGYDTKTFARKFPRLKRPQVKNLKKTNKEHSPTKASNSKAQLKKKYIKNQSRETQPA